MKTRNNRTTIWVSEDTWKKLNDMKEAPEDTFDSVINRIIKKVKKHV